MTGPHILAIDPGSARCGYAILHGEGGRVSFMSSGFLDAELHAFVEVMGGAERYADCNKSPLVIAIERPAGFVHEHVRGANLMATAGVAYAMDWVARYLGHFTVNLSAAQVRQQIVGRSTLTFGRAQKKGDMDRTIASVLPHFVDGLPKRSNMHTRDAMLLGVAANWAWLSTQQRRTA